MTNHTCLNCKKKPYETNFLVSKDKQFTLCNDCIRTRYKDKYNEYKKHYPQHFEFKKFIHIKRIQGWEFTQYDIFKLINYLDFYLPSLAITIPILDEDGLESPLLKRVVKEHNLFETNLLERIVHIKREKTGGKKNKANHPGIYLTNQKYQVYATINRRQLYVGTYNNIEEAIEKKLAFIKMYNNGSIEN